MQLGAVWENLNPAYSAVMLLAVLSGAVLLHFRQMRLALSWREKLGLGVGAFFGGMLGAKLPFVLSDPQGLRSGLAWFADGKTILCGLVGAYLGVEVAKWTLEIRVKTGDSFAVPAAVAIGIGRFGCFVGGCCYGQPTRLPWGVTFPGVEGPRHPTQLYEMAFHLTAAAVLWRLQRQGRFRGQLFKLYLISYFSFRFVTEFLRPEVPLWLGLTGYQWSALLLIAVFSALWLRDARSAEPTVYEASGCT